MASRKIGSDVRIVSDGCITKIFVDDTEVKDVKEYSIGCDAENNITTLKLELIVDNLDVKALNVLISTKS